MFSSSPAFEPDTFVGKRVPCCLACFLLKVVGLGGLSG